MAIMNTKLGVNTGGVPRAKPESTTNSNLTPQQKEKLGGENTGEVANKIVDPTWTDPSKKMRATGNANLDKDAFFKLMLTQMKNQDPTNPLKSHEMAAQLATFTSLEQMQNMNKSLEDLKEAQKPMQNYEALNLIGKSVAGDSSQVIRGVNDKSHDFKFNLPLDAQEVKVSVRNSEGELLRTYEMKNVKKGENKISWNGEDERSQKMPPGEYRFSAEATNANGKKIAIKTNFDGVITGVSYSQAGPILHVGDQAIRFSDVQKITDPRLMSNDQNVNDLTKLDLKKNDATGQTNMEGIVESKAATVNSSPKANQKVMADLELSRDLKERIAKEKKR
jgi:flagellar basal-body rod modification protein FlgD